MSTYLLAFIVGEFDYISGMAKMHNGEEVEVKRRPISLVTKSLDSCVYPGGQEAARPARPQRFAEVLALL